MKKRLFEGIKEKIQDKRVFREGSFDLDSFGERVSRFFDTEPEKERVLRNEDFDAAGDPYYAVVSARYKVAQRVSLCLLVLFILISILFNIKSITFDNLFYLVKDLGAAADISETNYESLSYDAAANQSYSLYRGGLSVVSRTNVSAFTSTGRRTLNTSAAYSSPVPATDGKYLYVYDMGDNGFDVYNSFAKIYSERTNYPIYDMVFSDDGSFVTLSRAEEFLSVLTVYDADFVAVAAYKRDNYAIDVSITKSGDRLGALYVGTKNGIVTTYVVFYDLRKEAKIAEYSYDGEFPLACAFLDGGDFVAITDSSVIVFDRRANEKSSPKSYSGKTVSGIFCDGEYCAVAVNDGVVTDINEIFVIDKQGNVIYDETVLSDVSELAVKEGYIFIKNREGAMRIGLKNKKSEQMAGGSGRMLVYDRSTVMICGASKAVYLDFDN